MRTRQVALMFIAVFCLFVNGCANSKESAPQPQKVARIEKISITGEIAKGANAYIIRGKVPAEVFTILNPNPEILDEYVTTGKVSEIEVKIVSGDNVNILVIGGKVYQAPGSARVENISINGQIAKGMNAYIIRGKVPSSIFTILNPDPTILDEYVTSGKVLDIEVRIVSGDNVEITFINGKKYPQEKN